jgi:cell division septation protein DedD
MPTDHETRQERVTSRGGETARTSTDVHDAQRQFPRLEEPSWLEDDLEDEEEAPRDSAFRGIWIGIAAAAVTFGLVFAVPHWLGWYHLGGTGQRQTRESTPESAISTVTANSSAGAPADGVPTEAAPQPATPPATPPKAAAPKTPPRPAEPEPAGVSGKNAAPEKPAKAAASSKRTYSVQIAAFKDAKQAGRLAERVKRDGYRADVRRVESSVPWVVRIGGYTSREQAESARDALARKGFHGFVL